MSIPTIQTAFAAGEISPGLYGNVALAKVHVAATTMRNCFVSTRGGALSRAGSEYVLQSQTPITEGYPPRIITFSYSISQNYLLEVGSNTGFSYMRFYVDGSPVVQAAVNISGITQANPAVVTAVGHGFSTGTWVALGGINGMTPLNGRFAYVTVIDANHVSLTMLNSTSLDSTSFPPYISGGTIAAIYQIATPWVAADFAMLKFTQSADVMSITHPSYPQYDLRRISGNNWTLTATSFAGSQQPLAAAPTVVSTAKPNPATSPPVLPCTYAYVVTCVSTTGEESIASPRGYALDCVDMAVTAGSNIVTWAGGTTGAVRYNIYRGPTNYDTDPGNPGFAKPPPVGEIYSYVGTSYGLEFVDSNVIPDGTQTPPLHKDPFSVGQIIGAEPAGVGAGYSTATVSITTSTGSGAIITPVVQSGKVNGYIIEDTGKNYAAMDFATVTGDGVGAGITITIGAHSGTYPGVVSYYQQRRVYGGSNNQPDALWFSKPGFFTNFDSAVPSEPDDAITTTPWAQQVNGILWLLQQPGGLVAATGAGFWLLNGTGGSGLNPQPLTPSSTQAVPAMVAGVSALVQPIPIYGDIVYVRAKGYSVCSIIYNYFTNNFTPSDLTLLSNHLFFGLDIRQWTWCEEPYKVVWAIRCDGVLLSLTYLKEQEVYGWARHDTAGAYVSVTAVSEPPIDVLYAAVQRSTPAGQYYFIERFDGRVWLDTEDPFCVDAGLENPMPAFTAALTASALTGAVTFSAATAIFTSSMVGSVLRISGGIALLQVYTDTKHMNGTWLLSPAAAAVIPSGNYQFLSCQNGFTITTPITVMYGFDHLIGMPVRGLADGIPIGPITVAADGSVTLPFAASNVKLGLSFTAQVQTPYLDAGAPTVQGRRKNIVAVTARVEGSLGVEVGTNQPDGAAQQPIQIAPPWTGMQADPATVTGGSVGPQTYLSPAGQVVTKLYTGDLRSPVLSDWQVPGQVAIQQTGPQPLNLMAVMPELLDGDLPEAGYSPQQRQRDPKQGARGPGLWMLADE